MLSPSREATPLLRPDIRHTDSKIPLFYPPPESPPLLSRQISDTLRLKTLISGLIRGMASLEGDNILLF
jgi:hypothetical protein